MNGQRDTGKVQSITVFDNGGAGLRMIFCRISNEFLYGGSLPEIRSPRNASYLSELFTKPGSIPVHFNVKNVTLEADKKITINLVGSELEKYL